MTYSKYKKNIIKLTDWSKAYYIDEPIVSDGVFDALLHEVREYETKHNVKSDITTKVISEHTKGFQKIKHTTRLLSLRDVFSLEEATLWIDTLNNSIVTIEPKYDGLTVALTYSRGKLVSAVTRGSDGTEGDDVTLNANTIRSIPSTIKFKVDMTIIGEVVMSKSIFNKLNTARIKSNDKPFSNPRNAASGSLKQLDYRITAFRFLDFYPFDVTIPNSDDDKSTLLHRLDSVGFNKPIFYHYLDSVNLEELYNEVVNNLPSFDIPLDGLVLKIDSQSKRIELGIVDKFPKYAIAFKFPNIEYVTTVRNIINQVGKTGTITPVAMVDVVDISGVNVSKSTLHNYNEIERLGIMINDQIVITRSGDVIPKILRVLKDKRIGIEIPIVPPTSCPTCESDLVDLTCINSECPDIIKFKLAHYVSVDRMNIKGLGETIIEHLVNNGILKTYSDIYTLAGTDKLDFLGDKTKHKIFKNIENSKRVKLHKFLASIGISNIGSRAGKLIADVFCENYANAKKEELLSIKGVGDEMATAYINYMQENKEEINKLATILIIEVPEFKSEKGLHNNVYCITGIFQFKRNELSELIEAYGGTVSNSVSKNTNMLIVGDNAGSKIDKARKLGVTILTPLNKDKYEIIDSILEGKPF